MNSRGDGAKGAVRGNRAQELWSGGGEEVGVTPGILGVCEETDFGNRKILTFDFKESWRFSGGGVDSG